MTIYEELIEKVSNGETFHIDFEKQTMKVGKQKLIDNGKYDENRVLIDTSMYPNVHVVLHIVELLYNNYKHSLPSERSDSKRKKYFKALSVEELTDEQLMLADRREVTQAALEGFILCTVLNGAFSWSDEMGSWFWQSVNDSDLVILKSWIKNK